LAKARGLRTASADEARRCFEEARTVYQQAYNAARDLFAKENSLEAGGSAYYLGINAASMAAWSGHGDEALVLAREVLDICAAVEKARGVRPPDPWLEATRGEAHLLRNEGAAAGAAYRAAASALPGQWRPLQSMRRQALETARHTGFPEGETAGWFLLPEVRVAGLDGGDAPPDGAIVFFYLREPGQLTEAAALAERSAEFHLGLEQPLEKFRARLAPEGNALLEKIMARATRVLGQKETQIVREEISPALARAFFCGSVLLRARELDTPATGLPRLDSADLDFRTDGGSPFRAVLCADAKGYSRLDAPRLRVFVREFLGRVGAAVDRFRAQTVTVKTTGDGLFMVFKNLPDAIRFSLELRDTVRAVDWGALGLPEDLGLRISLDAGPVLEFDDPVSGCRDVAGSLVNRAARIEPITPVNHVYASRTVAALATALGLPGVRFEYAGETPLPKGFGSFQLYHLTAA
jgi:class 3 adenylate cyclase